MTTVQARRAELGRRIRHLREKRGFRQVDLAAKASMSWRHLIRIEQGLGGEPKPETLGRLADALGVDRSTLSGDDDEEDSEPMRQLTHALMAVVRAELAKERV